MNEIRPGVVNAIELKLEIEGRFHSPLENADDTPAFFFAARGRADSLGLDHFIEKGVVTPEILLQVVIVFFIPDMDGGDQGDLNPFLVTVGDDRGLQFARLFALILKLKELGLVDRPRMDS